MGSIGSGRVRVIARIRADTVPGLKPLILVSRPDPECSARVKVSFDSEQITSKQIYQVDECYEQSIGNDELFSKEVKPLISGLFQGQNATVFAFGSRGSGKTYTFQGSKEDIGLAALTLESILPRVEEERNVVNVSVFEVCQDRIIDLLDSKRSEVSIYEDAQGRIRLKGLSKMKMDSTEEFQRLYRNATITRTPKGTELLQRSHVGCILHVVSQTENSNAKLVGKINFIDLASYEDSRRMSSDGFSLTETTRIKKSLNAVHNVLYALNAKDRVPYRESKLTRMLQDSLGGSSRTLMVTCMSPSFCQDTVQAIGVASRLCMAGLVSNLDPNKSGRSVNKSTGLSVSQIMKSASKLSTKTKLMSPKVLKSMSGSVSARKHTISNLSVHMASGGVAVQTNGRKLFVDTPIKQGKSLKQENVCTTAAAITVDSVAQSEANSTLESEATSDFFTRIEEKSTVIGNLETDTSLLLSEKPLQDESTVDANSEIDSSKLLTEKETSNASSDANSSQILLEEDIIQVESNFTDTPCAYKTPTKGSHLIKDKVNDGPSPPLSARLRDLSNNLRSICISTEANLKMAQESSRSFNQVTNENLEPKTPTTQSSARAKEKYEMTNTTSPWTKLKDSSRLYNQVIHEYSEPKTPTVQSSARGNENCDKTNASPWTGVKDSLVKESLKFLNSANKEELKRLKGIGEKRSTYILELRDESPEPFKELGDLKDIGLSEKQIKTLMKDVAGNLFT